MAKRNVHLDSIRCKFCGDFDEMAEHLFIFCNMAQVIWDYVACWCRLQAFFAFGVKNQVNLHKQFRRLKKWRAAVYTIIQTVV
ncbi:putative reverse transcriptase zinc-binding domain-containing protein [Helianthus anomalus]